jgi:hypothetical protein
LERSENAGRADPRAPIPDIASLIQATRLKNTASMPEERTKILAGAGFGRLVLIVRRTDGNFTYRIRTMGGSPGADCGIYDSPQTAEEEAWALAPFGGARIGLEAGGEVVVRRSRHSGHGTDASMKKL